MSNPSQEPQDPAALLAAYTQGRDVGCPACGYNLRNTAASACPECGEPLALAVGSANPCGAAWTVVVAAGAVPVGFAATLLASAAIEWRTYGDLSSAQVTGCVTVGFLGLVSLAALVLVHRKRDRFFAARHNRQWALAGVAVTAMLLQQALIVGALTLIQR